MPDTGIDTGIRFVVFRRTGGDVPTIVDAIASRSRQDTDRRFAAAAPARFEVLLVTADWSEARERIVAGRRADGDTAYPVVREGYHLGHCDACLNDWHHCDECAAVVGHGHEHDDLDDALSDGTDLIRDL